MRRALRWIGWLTASAVAVVLLIETAGRLLVPVRGAASDRVAFFTRGSFAGAGDGGVAYAAKQLLRTIAVHGRSIAYDVRFPTNDFGLIDEIDYGDTSHTAPAGENKPLGRTIAVAGESFTAGYHGGGPWILDLRERLRAQEPWAQVYNLGVDGVGLSNALPLLERINRVVPISDVLIVAVSEALLRAPFQPVEDEAGIRFCAVATPKELCLASKPVHPTFTEPFADADALRQAEAFRQTWAAVGTGRLVEFLKYQTVLGALAYRVIEQRRYARFGAENLNRLAEITQRFPNVKLAVLHLPDKREVMTAAYAAALGEVVRSRGYGYFSGLERCALEQGDFHANDHHPNAKGYAKIASCAASVLAEMGRS